MGGLLASLHDGIQEFGGGTVGRQVLLRQACIANHSDQQVVEIVRNAAGEHADALEFLGLAKALLRFLTFGDVCHERQPQFRSRMAKIIMPRGCST